MRSSFLGGFFFIVMAALIVATPAQAASTIYTGELSADNGLVATGAWDASATKLQWQVDNVTTPGLWHYSYTLTLAASPSMSHIIVEVSDDDPGPAFGSANLFNPVADPDGWLGPILIDTHQTGGGANPNMPADMYGIKFEAAEEQSNLILTLSFDSDRVPVWGNFYAKGGSATDLWNAGFTTDVLAPPSSGSLSYKVLVPDTLTTVIPAPGAILLGAIGTGLVGWMRRRRTL